MSIKDAAKIMGDRLYRKGFAAPTISATEMEQMDLARLVETQTIQAQLDINRRRVEAEQEAMKRNLALGALGQVGQMGSQSIWTGVRQSPSMYINPPTDQYTSHTAPEVEVEKFVNDAYETAESVIESSTGFDPSPVADGDWVNVVESFDGKMCLAEYDLEADLERIHEIPGVLPSVSIRVNKMDGEAVSGTSGWLVVEPVPLSKGGGHIRVLQNKLPTHLTLETAIALADSIYEQVGRIREIRHDIDTTLAPPRCGESFDQNCWGGGDNQRSRQEGAQIL